ncbi:MAG: lysozyme inhibitor LprI family protein [Helicobacteraceae bacterium]|nr:lysozyme inhibitor LprI family protein [Helicobacteraceae bacterium]
MKKIRVLLAIGVFAVSGVCGDYEVADKELNRVYSLVKARLDGGGAKKLTNAQRAWISFRDLHCDFQALGSEGASAHSIVIEACMTDMAKKRTNELKWFLTCEEGDLSCPTFASD